MEKEMQDYLADLLLNLIDARPGKDRKEAAMYFIRSLADELLESASKPSACVIVESETKSWICSRCGQRNAGWAKTCGRCEDQ